MKISPSIPEITAAELARSLEGGDPLQIVDVRAPFRVESGRIDPGPGQTFHNLVGSRLLTRTDPSDTGLDRCVPVVVVCGHGNSSRQGTHHLNALGFQACSLRGGMASWANVVLERELPAPPSLDHLIQFDRVAKGALGYLLVSEGKALIVDPPREAEDYLRKARELGAEVVGVADTHVHADYLSGSPTLSRELGVPYHLHPADAVYPYDGTPGRLDFRPLEGGGTIELGRARIRARHTPGHTVGSLTFEVDDVALTGDFLFVESVGRPDLAGKSKEWTVDLWSSLETVRRSWPPETRIYPAHYASESERAGDRSIGETFGRLPDRNAALRIDDASAFADWVEARSGSFPEAYRTIKAVNIELVSVTPDEAEVLEIGRNECALG